MQPLRCALGSQTHTNSRTLKYLSLGCPQSRLPERDVHSRGELPPLFGDPLLLRLTADRVGRAGRRSTGVSVKKRLVPHQTAPASAVSEAVVSAAWQMQERDFGLSGKSERPISQIRGLDCLMVAYMYMNMHSHVHTYTHTHTRMVLGSLVVSRVEPVAVSSEEDSMRLWGIRSSGDRSPHLVPREFERGSFFLFTALCHGEAQSIGQTPLIAKGHIFVVLC